MGSVTRFILCLVLAAMALSPPIAFAQGNKGGGGTTANNVTTAYDAGANTLYIFGDAGNNMIHISLRGTDAVISPGIWNQTSIDGQKDSRVYSTDSTMTLHVVIDTATGNDRIWVAVPLSALLATLSINGADGADEIAVYPSSNSGGCQLTGSVELDGGKGDDSLSLGAFEILGTAVVYAGDGNDSVTVHAGAIISNAATFNGGKGRDQLSVSTAVIAMATVSGFENVIVQ